MAEENDDLEKYFGSETESEDEVEEKVETEETETEAEAEEAEAEETETEETETTSDETETFTKSAAYPAYQDEKRKRQELEKRLEQIESRLPKEEEELPDPFEDREAYEAALRAKWEREQAEKAQADRMKKIEERRTQLLETKDDFAQMEQIFDILSVRNPEVRQEMLESNDPVGYAYNKAKEYHDEVMKPEKVLTEEMPDTSEVDKKPTPSKPNLAKASAGASNKVVVEKDADLDEELFADMKY